MTINLTKIATALGIIVSTSAIAGAAALYNPFVLKSEYEPLITLIGGDQSLDWQLRRDALEQDLFIVQGVAEKERQSTGQVSEATRRRLLNIQSQINAVNAKIEQYRKALNK